MEIYKQLPLDLQRLINEYAQDRDTYDDVMSELLSRMNREATSTIFNIIEQSNDYRKAYKLCRLYGYRHGLIELVFLVDFDIDVSEI